MTALPDVLLAPSREVALKNRLKTSRITTMTMVTTPRGMMVWFHFDVLSRTGAPQAV